MKKFVATAIKVVAPSAGKCSNVSDAKKRSSKKNESEVVVSSPPAKSQQKSIADVLGICNEGSPSRKVVFKCNVKNCKQKAVLAHIDVQGWGHTRIVRGAWKRNGRYLPSIWRVVNNIGFWS